MRALAKVHVRQRNEFNQHEKSPRERVSDPTDLSPILRSHNFFYLNQKEQLSQQLLEYLLPLQQRLSCKIDQIDIKFHSIINQTLRYILY